MQYGHSLPRLCYRAPRAFRYIHCCVAVSRQGEAMSDIENGQHWLDRNRAPRGQITYDVEIGDAVQNMELSLVVGILAHLDT